MRVRAARVGVVLTDLEIRITRGDSTGASVAALGSLLSDTPAGSLAAGRLSSLPPDSIAHLSRDRLTTVGKEAFELLEPEFVNAGAYLEAARLATAAGDTTFFNRHPVTALSSLDHVNPAADAAIRRAIMQLKSRVSVRPQNAAILNDAVAEALRAVTQ